MDVYVLNKNFELVGLCDDYKSIIWTTRYFTSGDFELYLPATDKNILLLKEERYVVRNQDMIVNGSDTIYKNVMIIRKIQIQTSVEDGNYLIVSGPCLKSILGRRIVWKQTTLSGKLEQALRRIVLENAIKPNISSRKINQLYLGSVQGFTETIDRQVTGANILEFMTEVCTAYGIGWDIYIKNNGFYFELYKGQNRSYVQNVNPYVVFSQEFDNLLTTDYEFDKTGYKNVALVAGEGEGLDRKMAVAGSASGLDRYELFVDSRNSSSDDGGISEAEYTALLIGEGNDALAEDENSIIENIEGQVEPLGNYQFGVDYFLGDIVEVINEYGIEMTPRITEIIECEDDTGSSTIPTFSK